MNIEHKMRSAYAVLCSCCTLVLDISEWSIGLNSLYSVISNAMIHNDIYFLFSLLFAISKLSVDDEEKLHLSNCVDDIME